MQTPILLITVLLTGLLVSWAFAGNLPAGMAKATFVVHCYDVGAHALEDKPGVLTVERGWSGSREVDRVVYNPQEVSLMQLEAWLKDADTYVSTLEITIASEPAKEMSQ